MKSFGFACILNPPSSFVLVKEMGFPSLTNVMFAISKGCFVIESCTIPDTFDCAMQDRERNMMITTNTYFIVQWDYKEYHLSSWGFHVRLLR